MLRWLKLHVMRHQEPVCCTGAALNTGSALVPMTLDVNDGVVQSERPPNPNASTETLKAPDESAYKDLTFPSWEEVLHSDASKKWLLHTTTKVVITTSREANRVAQPPVTVFCAIIMRGKDDEKC